MGSFLHFFRVTLTVLLGLACHTPMILALAADSDDSASSKLKEIENLEVWPLPHDVRGGSAIGSVNPASFQVSYNGAVVDGAASASETDTDTPQVGTLALNGVRRLLNTIFIADSGTRKYTRVSFPPVVNATTSLEQLLHHSQSQSGKFKANNDQKLPTFAKLEVLAPTDQTEPITAELLHHAAEEYELELQLHGGKLTAKTEVGILRGLETFAQLVRWMGREDGYLVGPLPLRIHDAPRFPWRGLMIDTARHYLPIGHIFKAIDGMVSFQIRIQAGFTTPRCSFLWLLLGLYERDNNVRLQLWPQV